jgi:hypothetical protein
MAAGDYIVLLLKKINITTLWLCYILTNSTTTAAAEKGPKGLHH